MTLSIRLKSYTKIAIKDLSWLFDQARWILIIYGLVIGLACSVVAFHMSSDLWSMAAVAALFLAISMKSWKAILSWLWFVLMNVPASQALSLTPRPGQHVEAFIVLFVAIVIWQVALFVKDRMKSQRPPVLQS